MKRESIGLPRALYKNHPPPSGLRGVDRVHSVPED